MSVALPAAAREFQGQRAGIVSRSAAAVIDIALVAVLVVGVVVARSVWTFFFGSHPLTLRWPSRLGLSSIGGIVLFVYLAWGWARTGKTIGKRVLGVSLVTSSGGRVSAIVATLRALLYVLFPIGLLWCSISSNQRSVQDIVLRTAVVYDWRGARHRAG